MDALYLRTKSPRYSVARQKQETLRYAASRGLVIEREHIEITPMTAELEDRKELIDFLHAMGEGDRLLVHDLWVLSPRAGELVKVFTCLFKREVQIHLCAKRLVVDKMTPSFVLLGLLNELRQKNIKEQKRLMGRPKGSVSSSKFDALKEEIVVMLRGKKSISEIARHLGVSRSSLSDYIRSRELGQAAAHVALYGSDAQSEEQSNVLAALAEQLGCPRESGRKPDQKKRSRV